MKTLKYFVLAAVTVIFASSAAMADGRDWGRRHHHNHHRHHDRYYVDVHRSWVPLAYPMRGYYAAPEPVYVAPPVRVVPNTVQIVDQVSSNCQPTSTIVNVDGSFRRIYGTACY